MGTERRSKDEEEMRRLEGERFWHGILPTAIATRVLQKQGEWLLRYSDKEDNRGFVITVYWADKPRHFMIRVNKTQGRFYVKAEATFAGVKDLVEFYSSEGRRLGKEEKDAHMLEAVGRERWELRPATIQRSKKIGEGNFGEVWQGLFVAPPAKEVEVAIKVCKEERDKETRARFRTEAMFQLRFEHKNVVRTLGIIVSEEPMLIVMELMKKGSLDQYLIADRKRLKNAKNTQMSWVRDAARGMHYLDSLRVIHRDLAARNCLLTEREELKISDFGHAKSMKSYTMEAGKVAVRWMSPESMRCGEYTAKSDVWAYGVLIWEILSLGKEPWPGLSQQEVKDKVLIKKERLEAPEGSPPFLLELMSNCWKEEPKDRPSFGGILSRLKESPAANIHSPSHLALSSRSLGRTSAKTKASTYRSAKRRSN